MIASFIYFSEGLSAGGIAGIVIGILLPLILISVLSYGCLETVINFVFNASEYDFFLLDFRTVPTA